MTLEDAAEAVKDWLSLQHITILPEMFGREMEPEHFRIGIVQVEPRACRRVFEIHPLEYPDCYELCEME